MKTWTVESPLGTATKCSFMEVSLTEGHKMCWSRVCWSPLWKLLLLEVKTFLHTTWSLLSCVRAEAVPKRLDWKCYLLDTINTPINKLQKDNIERKLDYIDKRFKPMPAWDSNYHVMQCIG